MIHKHVIGEEQQQLLNQIIEAQQKLTALHTEYCIKHELFQFQWWLLLAALVIPLIIWWILVDKTRFFQIAFLGCLAALVALEFDILGYEFGLWQYPHKLNYFGPRLGPVDVSVFPVTYMLIYQYFPNWKSYLVAAVVIALAFTFIAEPLLVYLGIYQLISWEYWYSLPIYFVIFILLKWFVDALALKFKQ